MRGTISPRKTSSPLKPSKNPEYGKLRLINSPTKDKPLNNSSSSPRKQKKIAPNNPINNCSPNAKANHRRTNSDAVKSVIRPIKAAIKVNILNKSEVQNFSHKKYYVVKSVKQVSFFQCTKRFKNFAVFPKLSNIFFRADVYM